MWQFIMPIVNKLYLINITFKHLVFMISILDLSPSLSLSLSVGSFLIIILFSTSPSFRMQNLEIVISTLYPNHLSRT